MRLRLMIALGLLAIVPAGCAGPDPSELHQAVKAHDEERVARLISEGVDVDAMTHEGQTPLHIAAKLGDLAILNRLLKAGAVVDVPAGNSTAGLSPLHVAAVYTNAECVEALIDAGASISIDNQSGRSALMWAAVGGDIAVLDHVVAAGANPLNATEYGQTAIYFSKTAECTSRLVELGADIEARTFRGRTPLMGAAGNLSPESMQVLIDCGAEIIASDNAGQTVLHIAAGWDWRATPEEIEPIILALIEAGAEVDAPDIYGMTPLMSAADTGTLAATSTLLDRGADPTIQNLIGLTALDVAVRRYESGAGTPVKELVDLLSSIEED